MLNDSFVPGRGYVEIVDGPLSISKECGKGNFISLNFREVVSSLASSIKSYSNPNATIEARDERRALFFINNFSVEHGRDLVIYNLLRH